MSERPTREMPTFCFRSPGRKAPIGHWLASLFPGLDRRSRRHWVDSGCLSIDGEVADRLGIDCPAGARVEIRLPNNDEFASSTAAPSSADAPGRRHARWVGLIDAPAWPGGALAREGDAPPIEFRVEEKHAGLARIRVAGPALAAREIRHAFAAAGMPLVGDLVHGGLGVTGGSCLIGADDSEDAGIDWPEEPAWCAEVRPEGDGGVDVAGEEANTLRVSDETARAIRKGHAWILADASSDPATRFRPGSLVRVVSRKAEPIAWAHVEGDPRLSARVWAAGSSELRKVPSVEARVARALARRRSLMTASGTKRTDAFRLIHGEGDDLPGLVVDRLGPLLRVLIVGRASEEILSRTIAALQTQLPVTPEGDPWNILELSHVKSVGSSHFDRVRWLSGGLAELAKQDVAMRETGFQVTERGLDFFVDPGWASPGQVRPGFGLFIDQRDNRARLDEIASRGGPWLNLFAHTGAFSVSLLAAGASHVTSVDLSAAYLERLALNLSLNADRAVDPSRHESVRIDGRRYLETLDAPKRFAGIVLDPPTAAAAGRRFWSVRRDLEPLVRQCVERLEHPGTLLVTQNRSGPPIGLDRILERAAGRAHRSIARLTPAPAGADHPARDGFPEGDPFEGWLLELD